MTGAFTPPTRRNSTSLSANCSDSSRLSPTSREFNTHRRRDSTRQLSCVCSVYWALVTTFYVKLYLVTCAVHHIYMACHRCDYLLAPNHTQKSCRELNLLLHSTGDCDDKQTDFIYNPDIREVSGFLKYAQFLQSTKCWAAKCRSMKCQDTVLDTLLDYRYQSSQIMLRKC